MSEEKRILIRKKQKFFKKIKPFWRIIPLSRCKEKKLKQKF